ncbi:MAG: transcription-repair coupling factor, partial [Alphaproteobacteria bacterium]|nr:transcription-repair coupling factor [Alphaproteobacteria bacterium]
MAQALAFFAPGLRIFQMPAWDCLPYDRVSPNAEIASRRMDTLCRLGMDGLGRGDVLITTVNALLQRVPARALVAASSFRARVGDHVEIEGLTAYLARNGYSRVATVMEPGEYAVRG